MRNLSRDAGSFGVSAVISPFSASKWNLQRSAPWLEMAAQIPKSTIHANFILFLPNVIDEPRPGDYYDLPSATSSFKKPQSNGGRTDQAVGSGALLGSFFICAFGARYTELLLQSRSESGSPEG